MTHRILIVEDEPSIAELIAINLSHAGYEVEKAMQTDLALAMMKDQLPSLIILDWMMPGKSGVQFAKELRANERTKGLPILMLTAKSEESDKVLGLDSGADDYVTKPFSPRELFARIRAVIRRAVPHEGDDPIEVDGLLLNPILHAVTVRGDTLELGPTEFRLLHFFMTHQDRVYSRNQLLDWVWGANAFIEERTVDVYIRRLRAALEKHSYGALIKTVRGVGYQFVGTSRR